MTTNPKHAPLHSTAVPGHAVTHHPALPHPGGFLGVTVRHLLDMLHAHPLWVALLFVALLYAAYARVTGRWNLTVLAIGADGKLSTSKFQFLLWTCPVLYVAIALIFAHAADLTFLSKIPQNIFVAMGFSLTTAVGAKYIVVSQTKSALPVTGMPLTLSPLYLIADNDGRLDLNKAQMLAWTAVAVVAFLYDFLANYGGYIICVPYCFPDIPSALMILMGLGQGAYLGGKITSTVGASS